MEVTVVGKCLNKVKVNTKIGSFSGIWCSSDPTLFKKYCVELDCDEVINPDDIDISRDCNPSIESINGNIYITGMLEEIQDNIMTLRLQESIIIVEISSNTLISDYVGNYIRIKLNEVKLYDTGIWRYL